eukprot:1240618-Amorphochlora_amoeboformis.AAC.1
MRSQPERKRLRVPGFSYLPNKFSFEAIWTLKLNDRVNVWKICANTPNPSSNTHSRAYAVPFEGINHRCGGSHYGVYPES